MSAEPEPAAVPAAETPSAAVPTSAEQSNPVQDVPTPEALPAKEVQAPAGSPLSDLFAELPSITEEAGYKEMWGVELSEDSHVPTTIVLEKFLRANTKDVAKAKAQLIQALKWRKDMQPIALLAETQFDPAKFGGLGYVTTYPKSDGHGKEIVTWNIYGAVKDNKVTFGNVEEFVKYSYPFGSLSI